MKHPLVLLGLRLLAVAFSLSLVGGYVCFTQRKAQPPEALASEEFVHDGEAIEAAAQDAAGNPQPAMLGTKSFSQPIFSTRKVEEATRAVQPPASKWMMPGSKSYTGAVTVVAGQLQMGAPAEPASPTSKVVVIPRPGGGNGTVVPGTTDERIADAQIKPPSRSDVVMPGSKIGRVFWASQVVIPGSKGAGRVSTAEAASPDSPELPVAQAASAPAKVSKPKMMPGSKSGVLELGLLWTQFVRMPSEVVTPDPFASDIPQHSPSASLEPAPDAPAAKRGGDAPPSRRIIMSGSKSGLLEIPAPAKAPDKQESNEPLFNDIPILKKLFQTKEEHKAEKGNQQAAQLPQPRPMMHSSKWAPIEVPVAPKTPAMPPKP